MKLRYYVLMCLVLSFSCSVAQTDASLLQLYQQLDAEIEHTDKYVAAKEQHIGELRKRLYGSSDDIERYHWADSLFDIYHNYQNDSAISYALRTIDYARHANRPDLVNSSTIAIADQFAATGLYDEAKEYLSRINKHQLDSGLLLRYYYAQRQLYGELGVYGHDEMLKQRNFKLERSYRDSMMAIIDTTSTLYLQERINILCQQQRYQDALPLCNRWLQREQPQTAGYALMAFYFSEVCKGLQDHEGQKRWLALSALSDIHCAITNQASLWSLAALLSKEGDVERSYEYIDYSWLCASRFNAHLRHWQVSPIMTAIDHVYKNEQRVKQRNLYLFMVFVSLISLVLLGLIIYSRHKRRQLAAARNELADLNGQLNNNNSELQKANQLLLDANTLLKDTNEKLSLAIAHLNDSNRVKDEYIGKFLSLCSEYIDKLDNYRIKVNRKLRANQLADLKRMTESEQLREDELKELFANFDAVFLHLFPNFVAEFNALLRPEEQITLTEPGQMTPELRIFALIRLGINESSRIAEFLHFSPNTIYAYRARIKNKAAGNRDDFERLVKEIGIR